MLNIKIFSRVLVVIAHPDDEWWGLGGTLLYLKKSGAKVKVVMVSNGERGDNLGESRLISSEGLINRLGFEWECLKIRANNFPSNQELIIKELDRITEDFVPNTIFTHFENDFHQDHRITYQSIIAVMRNYLDLSLFQIETPFKINFNPNFFVNIGEAFEFKEKMYREYYKWEINHRREFSVDNLEITNRFRGAQFGVKYAEGFVYRGGI